LYYPRYVFIPRIILTVDVSEIGPQEQAHGDIDSGHVRSHGIRDSDLGHGGLSRKY